MAFYLEIILLILGIVFWIWTLVVACRTIKERRLMLEVLEATKRDIDIIKNIIRKPRR